ncbi:MAG: alpha/beta hydrolase [Acidimicrobiales bacterium]
MSIDLHPQAAMVLEAMAALGGPVIHESTPDEFRAYYATRAVPPTEPIHESRDISAGGVPCRLYRPDSSAVLPLLVYYHGGGWVIGGLDSHDNVCRSLANKSGAAVLSVDYRLAPEHPFPAAAEDALCALRWAHENASDIGVDPGRIAVGGDSAGGNLAAIVAQQRPVPLCFQLLIYPSVDMTQSFPSHAENAAGPVLTDKAMEWFIGHYVQDRSRLRDELASPWFADDSMLRGTPPALVITAQFDPLRDEGEAYGARLIRNGTPASIVRFNGQFHSFFGMLGLLDDAEAAHTISASALRRAFAAS